MAGSSPGQRERSGSLVLQRQQEPARRCRQSLLPSLLIVEHTLMQPYGSGQRAWQGAGYVCINAIVIALLRCGWQVMYSRPVAYYVMECSTQFPPERQSNPAQHLIQKSFDG